MKAKTKAQIETNLSSNQQRFIQICKHLEYSSTQTKQPLKEEAQYKSS